MINVKIPVLAFEEITVDDFVEKAKSFIKHGDPKFSLWQVVGLPGFAKQVYPAVIVGMSPRDGGWVYDVIRPSSAYGVERTSVNECNITVLT